MEPAAGFVVLKWWCGCRGASTLCSIGQQGNDYADRAANLWSISRSRDGCAPYSV